MSVYDTTDPKPKYRPSFIVDGLNISDEVPKLCIKCFLSKYSIRHFKDDTMFAQIHSPPRIKDETF